MLKSSKSQAEKKRDHSDESANVRPPHQYNKTVKIVDEL